MAESTDDIIILSDDDVQIESVVTPKHSKTTNNHNSHTTRTNSTSIKRRTPLLVLTEPKSLSYGIERGYKLKYIHGIKRLNSTNELMYLVEYDLCDDYEFVPSTILKNIVIKIFL